MGAKPLMMALTAVMLLACQPPTQTQHATVPDEPLDPFVVMIGAERWGVMIDRALEGVRAGPGRGDAYLENEIYRADLALKSGAANLIELRNEACAKGLVAGAGCNLGEWPAWTREPPTDSTHIEEIQRRSAWLSKQMTLFTGVGCEVGRKATGDELFCSVE